MNFDIHCHALLVAAGYEHVHVPAKWEDIGNAERGPKIVGHPAFVEYHLDGHYIVVEHGEIVHQAHESDGPDIPF